MSMMAVKELKAANGTSPDPIGQGETNGEMHILLFAGQNSGAIIYNDINGLSSGTGPGTLYTDVVPAVTIMDFNDAPTMNHSGVTTSGGDLVVNDQYALWRCVSQGLRLSLLNPAETNDGWFEACRIRQGLETDQYALLSLDGAAIDTRSTLVPRFLMDRMAIKDIVNERSYTTGTLKELKDHVFQLRPHLNDHEFCQQMDRFKFDLSDVLVRTAAGAAGDYAAFADGKDNLRQLINMHVDPAFDMIYIRIHGRASGENTKLHAQLIGNHEVVFETESREGKFHTPTAVVKDVEMTHVGAPPGAGHRPGM